VAYTYNFTTALRNGAPFVLEIGMSSFDLTNAMLEQEDKRIRSDAHPKSPVAHQRRVTNRYHNTLPMPPRPSAYSVGGKTIAEVSAALLWFGLWIFNGICTTLAWLTFVRWIASKLGYNGIAVDPWLQVPIGVVVHLAISSIEQHLWRELDNLPMQPMTLEQRISRLLSNVRTWESVAIGAIDSLTTARVLMVVLGWFAVSGLSAIIGAACIGTLLALVCEPMLRYHGNGLRSITRRER
jgi:hypothetical protein